MGIRDFADLDYGREKRTGFPEIVFASGKTNEQLLAILKELKKKNNGAFPTIATKVSPDQAKFVRSHIKSIKYYDNAKILTVPTQSTKVKQPKKNSSDVVAVVCAGTSDVNIAEEAAILCELYGRTVSRYYDVGVAGIERLLNKIEEIRKAKVVIAVAGMEGALPSVVAGLVSVPVIAVPTSIGYGSNFNGITPLLSMLNSCALGVSVVNIDNGIGAGHLACMMIN